MSDPAPAPPSAEFVSLLTEFQPELWAYTISLMPGHPDVADVVQKVNIVLWRKQADFEIGTNFRAWVFAIARYEVLSHLKKEKHSRVIPLDADLLDLLADEAIKTETEPEDPNRHLEALEACLARLKPEDRELLHHRYATDRPLSDFGKRSAASLSVTLHRLRAGIRKCVQARLARERRLA